MPMIEPYLTIQELVALPGPVIPTLHGLALSDDGESLAYVRRTADWGRDRFLERVWLYRRPGAGDRPVTAEDWPSWSPAWSADSRWLAYLAPAGADGQPQLFVQPGDGGEAFQATRAEKGVRRFRWSPDGESLFFLSPASEPEGRQRRRQTYGDLEFVDREPPMNCLNRIEPEGGTPCQLTGGRSLHIHDLDVAPDGQRVVFTAAPAPGRRYLDELSLYLLEPAGLRRLAAPPASRHPVFFAPDGRPVAYHFHRDGQLPNNYTLAILDPEAGESVVPALDLDEDLDAALWLRGAFLVSWWERTNRRVGLLDERGVLQPLVTGDPCVALSPSISRDGRHLACVVVTADRTAELYLDGERISDQSVGLTGRSLSHRELIRWQSTDGIDIEGVLSTPARFDRARRCPLLVIVHGGPRGIALPVRLFPEFHPVEQFVGRGFLVLEPNYRGSVGYGEAFRRLNVGALGTGDFADVISGVDYLVAAGLVDPERVGVIGWSQGGYVAAFCAAFGSATLTTRGGAHFRAASAGAGIGDWRTYYAASDNLPFVSAYLGAAPWENEELYCRASPMTYLRRARTPVLIQHGECDARVPVSYAHELYRGMRGMGVPAEMVLFNEMGHVPDRPGHFRVIMEQNLAWFCHHLLGESLGGLCWRQ